MCYTTTLLQHMGQSAKKNGCPSNHDVVRYVALGQKMQEAIRRILEPNSELLFKRVDNETEKLTWQTNDGIHILNVLHK